MVMLAFFWGGEVIIFHLAFPENIFLDQTESEKVSINLRNTSFDNIAIQASHIQ